MDIYLDVIKEIVEKEKVFIEERFYEECTFLSFLIIKGHSFNIRISKEKTFVIYGEDEATYHDVEEIDLNESFKKKFGEFIKEKKIKLMYQTRYEKWLSEFSIRLRENGIRCNKEKTKIQINQFFNVCDVHQREIVLMKLMLNPLRDIYPFVKKDEDIILFSQKGKELGSIKIKEIEG
jgi:hypothetical protein